jgi:dTDP-4-dehydrorhamnose reductase
MFRSKIITGGSGRLGKEILKLDQSFLSPSSKDLDISDYGKAESYMFKNMNAGLILNCAAFTDTVDAERNPEKCFAVNMCGPLNLLRLMPLGCRFVHISTDYVFDGEEGPYSVGDKINPISNYARSKAAAEMVVQSFPNTLIIRTSFFPKEFPHDAAFTDQWTSKGYVDQIAPLILKKAMSNETGIIHVGFNRRTVYEVASERKKDLKKIKREAFSGKIRIPKDTSFRLQ